MQKLSISLGINSFYIKNHIFDLMKKLFYLIIFVCLIFIDVKATDFITRWDLSLGFGNNQINFNAVTSGNVNYTWETIPAGSSGSGSFNSSVVTITGLPWGGYYQAKDTTQQFATC
jgi:hypothetical protein